MVLGKTRKRAAGAHFFWCPYVLNLFEQNNNPIDQNQERATLVSDPRCDVGSVLVNDETLHVEAVSFNYEVRAHTFWQ